MKRDAHEITIKNARLNILAKGIQEEILIKAAHQTVMKKIINQGRWRER